MKRLLSKQPLDQSDTAQTGERRRLSKIVHDHKGNATVQWVDAPADYERPVFELEGTRPPPPPPASAGGAPGKRPTDLRRLSAWIKMMRALEEAKKNKGEESDD